MVWARAQVAATLQWYPNNGISIGVGVALLRVNYCTDSNNDKFKAFISLDLTVYEL
jgi:hypothetical protein